MKTLTEQIEEIKSSVADVWCKTMNGKTCEELVADIVKEALDKKSSHCFFIKNIV